MEAFGAALQVAPKASENASQLRFNLIVFVYCSFIPDFAFREL